MWEILTVKGRKVMVIMQACRVRRDTASPSGLPQRMPVLCVGKGGVKSCYLHLPLTDLPMGEDSDSLASSALPPLSILLWGTDLPDHCPTSSYPPCKTQTHQIEEGKRIINFPN